MSEKVDTVQDAPRPTNVSTLKAYLGLLSCYHQFLANLATLFAPMYVLLCRSQHWSWGEDQEKAFQASKKLHLNSQLLVYFDPSLKNVVACDASPYGIGAVLSHRMSDGQERPVGFVSRTLTSAEKNYSQIEMEGLACVFAVKRFHEYLCGHPFILQTYHKPLLSLFNENKAVPPQAAGRIQRWVLTLAAYQYTIQCHSTAQHANADALSWLPIEVSEETTPIPELVLMIENLKDAPLTPCQVALWTTRDPVLSRVFRYTQEGWP